MAAEMHLHNLGPTELRVTRFCQGTAFRNLGRGSEDGRSSRLLEAALDRGVNFYDTAQAYGWGTAESMLGSTIGNRRSQCIICTKVPPSGEPVSPNEKGQPVDFSEKYLVAQLEGSLRRLQTNYVDLYLLHSPDTRNDWLTVNNAMESLRHAGKNRYWGLSNHTAAAVRDCLSIAEDQGVEGPSVLEEYYTIAGYALNSDGFSRIRTTERELFPLAGSSGLGVMAFSPTDAGRITGCGHSDSDQDLVILARVLYAAAAALNTTRATLCAAWVLSHRQVDCVLAGPETEVHLDELIAGTCLELPESIVGDLNDASKVYSDSVERRAGVSS